MRWSEAVTLEFVKIYLKHEILWNPEHLYYRSRNHREKAYIKICSQFKASTTKSLTIPEVKMKIRNLRTTYQQQIQKILQKSSPDVIYEPTLIWFHEMDRCLKNISTRQTCSQLVQEAPEADSSSNTWLNVKSSTVEEHPDPLVTQSDENYDIPNTVHIKKEENNTHRKTKKKKFKYREQYTENSNINITDDEFDIYGKYIATQLRKMGLQRALRLQLEIQSIISEARISNII